MLSLIIKTLSKLSHSGFQSRMLYWFVFPAWGALCGVFSFPFSVLAVSLLPLVSLTGHFVSQPVLCPSCCFWCGLFSTVSCGESVLAVFRLCSELFTLMVLYSWTCGVSELRILLLCHPPQNSFLYYFRLIIFKRKIWYGQVLFLVIFLPDMLSFHLSVLFFLEVHQLFLHWFHRSFLLLP